MKQEIRIGGNEKNQRLDKFLRKLFKNVELNNMWQVWAKNRSYSFVVL